MLTPAAGPAFRFVGTLSVSVLTVALFLGWGRVNADPATLSIDSPTPCGPSASTVTALAMETSEEWPGRRYLRMEAEEGVLPGPAGWAEAAG